LARFTRAWGATVKFTYGSGAQPFRGYTIRRGLGRGGFGEVYLAVSDGGKEVALKLVQQHLDVELRGVGQCLNLKHPHLVEIYDILKPENDDTWIVMEYMAGETLHQALTRHPKGVPESQALGWLHGICSGVRYLHEHDIVHRDLKPGNLFIENGVVKIGDYGLSKFISASRRSGQTVSIGSVHYMAPEISRGWYGKEVDQYALGIILYEMLTGRVPFDGESQGEILMKHLTADPDLGRLTEPYRAVVARLLHKDPRKRYLAVQDLIAELPALAPAMAGVFPGSSAAGSPQQLARSETEIPAPDLESEVVKPCSNLEGGAPQPTAQRPRVARKRRFAKAPLIRSLAENWMEVNDIRRVIRALRRYPGQALAGLITVVQSMAEHSAEAKDMEHLVRVLARRPELDAPCIMAMLQTLAENDFDAGNIERVLSAVGERPEQGLASKVALVQDMVEHGVDAKDIERVLRALGACPKHELAAKLATVQEMVEHEMEARDIERILHALGECRGQALAAAASVVKSMIEHGVDAKGIERVLGALSEHPEQESAGVVAAVQSMVEDGMEPEKIEESVRARRATSRGRFAAGAYTEAGEYDAKAGCSSNATREQGSGRNMRNKKHDPKEPEFEEGSGNVLPTWTWTTAMSFRAGENRVSCLPSTQKKEPGAVRDRDAASH
jgi:Protein kinase domain